MFNKIIKTFTFLDESGALIPKDGQTRNYYGIGIIKHTNPIDLIQKLHPIYEELCQVLKKEETRVEFSFKSTTASSIKIDLKFLDAIKNDNNWEFNCIYIDVCDPKFIKPKDGYSLWDNYVQYSKLLIKNNLWPNEETVLIADYQRKPKLSKKQFEFISLDIPSVYNVLQVESHGILLVQAVDLFLGGFLYTLDSELGDKEGNKTKISQKIIEIKNKVGKSRFNVWKIDWNKSCRKRRV